VSVSASQASSIADLSNRILLQFYAPASVTTDAKGNILYVHGDTSRYLHQPAGPVTTNVIEMVCDELQMYLRTALQMASQGTPTLNQEVSLKAGGRVLRVNFSVHLLWSDNNDADTVDNLRLVSFQEVSKPARRRGNKGAASSVDAERLAQVERELAYVRESQQAYIEEQQTTTEELQSTNEELQSSNEELETSKEELQSLNEETLTINSELNGKIEHMNVIQNDLKNLLDNVNTATLFLDSQLLIRRYTREALKVYRLVASDIGRPLSDIKSNLEGEDFLVELNTVLETLIPCEREVCAIDGTWFLMHMQPYRTLDNVINGVVLTFTDISMNREAASIKLAAAQQAQELAVDIVNMVSDPLIILDGKLQVITSNRAFYQYFQVTPEQTVGRKIYDLGNGQWNIPALRELIENVLPQHRVMEGFVVEHNFPDLGSRRMVLNARRIVTAPGNAELILLVMVAIEAKELP
jgi:two-component system CheB/CheR fusion protein